MTDKIIPDLTSSKNNSNGCDLDTPEQLHELRNSVESWLKKAREAVWTFQNEGGALKGTFLRASDMKDNNHLSSTTTARCYMSLLYADRQIGSSKSSNISKWYKSLEECFNTIKFEIKDGEIVESIKKNGGASDNSPTRLNNFEIAHILDFDFAYNYCMRFNIECQNNGSDSTPPIFAENRKKLTKLLEDRLQEDDHIYDGQMFFNTGKKESRHFFVTLHMLRALSLLEEGKIKGQGISGKISDIVNSAKRFCIEQCFYINQNVRHKRDAARLVFASLIYCMYAEEVDRDVMIAIVKAIESMQEANGKWPDSYPINRYKDDNKTAWYIVSTELALSLTWLYFQPKLPDAARIIVLRMLRQHFQKWIVPTYRQHKTKEKVFKGWYDDSSAGHDRVLGWTTGITCHFLANYSAVLNDHINRSVIESLNLQNVAKRYMIDETATEKNPKWKVFASSGESPWPDLPPNSWSVKQVRSIEIKNKIIWNWTDPTKGSALSGKLSKHVICPILNNPMQRPKGYISGILGGPPGTRKTSLVRTLSKILDWPYIAVPASVIFEEGFDCMEAQASKVFRRLNYLTQCVVFFDEFEEFFRNRPTQKDGCGIEDCKNKTLEVNHGAVQIHNRTAAAFATSAMLPRLQDLHDSERSLILLATNDADGLDTAITRTGRFDFKENVDYPKLSRFTTQAQKQGYYKVPCCGWFGLGILNIPCDKDKFTPFKKLNEDGQNKLNHLTEILQKVLNDDTVSGEICKLQAILSEQGSDTELCKTCAEKSKKGVLPNDQHRIKLNLIENVAKLIVRELDTEGCVNDSDIIKSAVKELCKAIKNIIDSKGSAGQLPN